MPVKVNLVKDMLSLHSFQDSPDLPFVETDFRKRKPHPNYKMHYDTENAVIELARQHKKQIG